jgi:uncharacterized protein (TIGR03067 family)
MRSVLLTTAFVHLLAVAVCGQDQRAFREEKQDRTQLGDREDEFLDFFRRLTLSDADQQRLANLIQQLDATRFKDREKASAALIAEGPRGLPVLRKALPGASLEMRMRLERCIKTVQPPLWSPTIAERAEQVKGHPSAEAASTLLNFVPYAPDDAVDAVLDALRVVGVQGGKANATLVDALRDPLASKRAAAAVVVGVYGNADERKLVRRMLADPAALVRLRAAQGLLVTGEPDAVVVLIGLLAQADVPVAERAEALLAAVADTSAPQETLDRDGAKKCHAAWLAWWKENPDRLGNARRFGLRLQDNSFGLRALQGTWQLIHEIDSGRVVPCDPNETFAFSGKQLINKVGLKITDEFTVRIIPAKRPQQMDLIPLKEPNKGMPYPAIYKIEGGTLTICVAFQIGALRPQNFNSNMDNRWCVLTMKRV